MTIFEVLGVSIPILGLWASVWYKLGRLSQEVREHNEICHRLEKQMERLLTRGG